MRRRRCACNRAWIFGRVAGVGFECRGVVERNSLPRVLCSAYHAEIRITSRPRSQRLAYTACPFGNRQFSIRWQPSAHLRRRMHPSPRFTRSSSSLPYCGRPLLAQSPVTFNFARSLSSVRTVRGVSIKVWLRFLCFRCKIIRFAPICFASNERKRFGMYIAVYAEWDMRDHMRFKIISHFVQ